MNYTTFEDYVYSIFPRGSGAANSYITALNIIDNIFKQRDVFGLNDLPISEVRDPVLVERMIDFIAEEEDKFRKNEESFFDLGKATQTSYPKARFCTAAVRKLRDYVNMLNCKEAVNIVEQSRLSGRKLSASLVKKFNINEQGTDKEVRAKHRIGQEIFRAIILDI